MRDPALRTLKVRVLVCPGATAPKSSTLGVIERLGAALVPTPLPASGTITVERVGSSLVMLKELDNSPTAFGLKRTVKSCCRPDATVNGSAGETTLKRALLLEADFTMSAPLPELPMVIFRSLVCPEATLPKSSAAGVRSILGVGAVNAIPPR